jgi:AhpD family alkylhydroperoxidase
MARARTEPISEIATAKFNKRTYRGFGEFFSDMIFMTKNQRQAFRIMRGKVIPHTFRERLMLAVVSVYGCRYCSWGHTREALRRGVAKDEIGNLLAGSVDDCPEDEAVAVLYAQHWADSDMNPTPEACSRLEETYGAEKAQVINLVLRMNRVGNLSGNTLDRFLNRISFGRWGGTKQ